MIKQRYHQKRPFAQNFATIKRYVNEVIDNIDEDKYIIFQFFYDHMDSFFTKALNKKPFN